MGIEGKEELIHLGKGFGFDEETIEASQKANPLFRTGVYVHENYTWGV